TITFEFEQRDEKGMVLEAQVIQAWADVANALYQGGMGILTREQAASLLVENGIIPAEWTIMEEDVVATDVEEADEAEEGDVSEDDVDAPAAQRGKLVMRNLRARALQDERMVRAAEMYPREPIVRYRYDPRRGNG